MMGRAYVLFGRHIALGAWAWIRIGIGVHRGTAFGLASNRTELWVRIVSGEEGDTVPSTLVLLEYTFKSHLKHIVYPLATNLRFLLFFFQNVHPKC
jgi:hypothetical protein